MTSVIDINNIEKAKQQINTAKEKPIIIKAQDTIFNRKLLEYGKFDILLDVEKVKGKDSLRNINSGLNHVLAKITEKNNIALGIDISPLSAKNKKEKAILLTKLRQNIKICRKTNTKIKVLNYKNKKDSFALLLSLGCSTKQAKEAL